MRPLSQGQKAGVLSAEADRDRGVTGLAFFRRQLRPGVWTSWLTLGGRALWSRCATQEKPVATMELCPVAPIRQDSLRDGVRGWLGRAWSLFQPRSLWQVVRGLLGTRTGPVRAGRSFRWMVSPEAAWGLSLDSTLTWPLALRALSPLQPDHQPGIFKSVLRLTPS